MTRIRRGPGTNADAGSPTLVTALARGLQLLRSFGQASEFLSNAELSARTDIPRPTVSRLTATLTELGYLVYLPSIERYRLGPQVLDLGYRYLASEGVTRLAQPLMQTLADATDCFVAIGVVDGLDMTYVQTCQGQGPLILRAGVGTRIPMSHTAMGGAYLAGVDASTRGRHLQALQAAAPSEWSATADRMTRLAKEWSANGFCIAVGEWSSDISAVAVPLYIAPEQRWVVFNCSGSSLRLTRDVLMDNLGPRLRELVDQVGALLGQPAISDC